jgi:hypothetical protein
MTGGSDRRWRSAPRGGYASSDRTPEILSRYEAGNLLTLTHEPPRTTCEARRRKPISSPPGATGPPP